MVLGLAWVLILPLLLEFGYASLELAEHQVIEQQDMRQRRLNPLVWFGGRVVYLQGPNGAGFDRYQVVVFCQPERYQAMTLQVGRYSGYALSSATPGCAATSSPALRLSWSLLLLCTLLALFLPRQRHRRLAVLWQTLFLLPSLMLSAHFSWFVLLRYVGSV
jgi:hypothetical protein